jgi:phosphate transport system substrate-binding protein
MRTFTRDRALAGLVLTLGLVAAACGGSETSTSDTTGTTDGGDVAGTVLIAGSSTVAPIAELVSEDYSAVAPGVSAPVEVTGTGGGFKDRFCTGETAISNASRPIKDEEMELCAGNGVENILELRIGIDGMTVMTSTNNDQIAECLSFAEIYALVGPESGDVTSWADANALAGELGGHASGEEFPDVPLTTAGPGTESGTYDSFFELAIEGIAGDRAESGDLPEDHGKFRDDWTGNNDDNVIISGITGNDYSFGWVGFAYYIEVADQIRAFDVAGEDGTCVTPSADTIASGEYPLSRDLFVYVNLDQLEGADGEAIEGWVDYLLSDAGYELVAESGYVQLEEDAWAQTLQAWDAREANV